MGVAKSISGLARCTHRNVGAVVVSSEGRILGHGYAKGPYGQPTCIQGGCPRGKLPAGQGKSDYSDCITVHAEVGAIVMASPQFWHAATLYVNSEPCFMCYRVAEGSGIYRVVWQGGNEWDMYERHFFKP